MGNKPKQKQNNRNKQEDMGCKKKGKSKKGKKK
jgi:hypothetical protein